MKIFLRSQENSELKNDKPALIRDLLGKLDNTIEDMYPSVAKMLEAEAKVKAGLDVSDKARALAKSAENLPEYVKVATRWHDRAQTVVAPINKTLSSLYMGWNPSYAARNLSSNTVQMDRSGVWGVVPEDR